MYEIGWDDWLFLSFLHNPIHLESIWFFWGGGRIRANDKMKKNVEKGEKMKKEGVYYNYGVVQPVQRRDPLYSFFPSQKGMGRKLTYDSPPSSHLSYLHFCF